MSSYPNTVGPDFADAVALTGSLPITRSDDVGLYPVFFEDQDASPSYYGIEFHEPLPLNGNWDTIGAVQGSFWYKWTASISASMILKWTSDNIFVWASVYTGSSLESLDLVAQQGNQEWVGEVLTPRTVFTAKQGTTYYFQMAVTSWGSDSSPRQIDIDLRQGGHYAYAPFDGAPLVSSSYSETIEIPFDPEWGYGEAIRYFCVPEVSEWTDFTFTFGGDYGEGWDYYIEIIQGDYIDAAKYPTMTNGGDSGEVLGFRAAPGETYRLRVYVYGYEEGAQNHVQFAVDRQPYEWDWDFAYWNYQVNNYYSPTFITSVGATSPGPLFKDGKWMVEARNLFTLTDQGESFPLVSGSGDNWDMRLDGPTELSLSPDDRYYRVGYAVSPYLTPANIQIAYKTSSDGPTLTSSLSLPTGAPHYNYPIYLGFVGGMWIMVVTYGGNSYGPGSRRLYYTDDLAGSWTEGSTHADWYMGDTYASFGLPRFWYANGRWIAAIGNSNDYYRTSIYSTSSLTGTWAKEYTSPSYNFTTDEWPPGMYFFGDIGYSGDHGYYTTDMGTGIYYGSNESSGVWLWTSPDLTTWTPAAGFVDTFGASAIGTTGLAEIEGEFYALNYYQYGGDTRTNLAVWTSLDLLGPYTRETLFQPSPYLDIRTEFIGPHINGKDGEVVLTYGKGIWTRGGSADGASGGHWGTAL